MQPLDMEVGAGTFHPATFLRAIGPEVWNAAYVQPSRRPTDGRYGENPNRLQHYYQFQVVMKPSPADFQELYLGSLQSLGIDTLVHDVRFVEDNWESPTLGAWGLGWLRHESHRSPLANLVASTLPPACRTTLARSFGSWGWPVFMWSRTKARLSTGLPASVLPFSSTKV